jgi:uncharacterized protein YbbC (DUF1343 family)/CubicO group peptidase (beta-lactamase class C family)
MMRFLFRAEVLALSTVLILTGATPTLCAQKATSAQQANARFANLDPIVQEFVDKGKIPGAVLLVGHNGKVVYRKAFGQRSLEPTREPMTADTIFDIASVTKCVATTTAVMQLVEAGRVRLNDPVTAYLPEFGQNGKNQITVRELLTHYSGLIPDLEIKSAWKGRDTGYKMIMESKLYNTPGTRFVYSDLNFATLAYIVEKVSGEPFEQYTAKHIFEPLGMKNSRFLPPSDWDARIAPTEYDENGKMLRGVVHDPTTRRMGGVAGHAGLFSTADDLALFAESLLSGKGVLGPAIITKMSTPQQPSMAASLRGLGWDIDSPFSTNRGEFFPIGSFGHTGFTGTSLWIDPVTHTYVILLTNAVHPRGHGNAIALRARVASAVANDLDLTTSEADALRLARITGYNESMMGERNLTARNGSVKAGIDVLEDHAFRELAPNAAKPVRIGLIANHTALDAKGQRTADVLSHTPGLKLAAIFTPEHGLAGALDTTAISDSTDAATGAPVFSVYGDSATKRHPTDAQLAQVDLLVFDIQDAGVRFYTYETTLGYFLEAAAKTHKPIIVLDRPNPIGGTYLQGPISDAGTESFVNYFALPVRHGMTIGELARLFNSEKKIGADLRVVSMEGWMRGDWFDSTGLTWTAPSPNLRTLTEAAFYPGTGMIEGANISVGRGTDTPFEVVGAPWIDPKALASALNAREIQGVRFVPIHFTPTSSIYANKQCGGVNIVATYRDGLDASEMGLEIASALWNLYPDQFKLQSIDALVRNKATMDALRRGDDPKRIALDWQEALNAFEPLRAKYLLY